MSIIAKLFTPQLINQPKHIYRLFGLIFLLFGALVAMLTSVINYYVQYTNIEQQIADKFVSEKSEKQTIIQAFTQHNRAQMAALAKSQLTHSFLDSPSDGDQYNLTQLMLATIQANRQFTQLRLIDNQGLERIRISQSDGKPHITPHSELQNKQNRYYFDAAMKLNNNGFWYSNFDLNVEHGKIELPIKPTLRIATPLFYQNKRYGFVIANINISPLLKLLASSANFDIYVIDEQGEFIVHPDSDYAWSRYLPDRPSFHSQFAESNSEAFASQQYAFSLSEFIDNQDNASLLMFPKQELLLEFQQHNMISTALIAVTVIVVSFVLSWFAALFPTRLQQALSEAYQRIKRYTQIIDKHVITSSTDTKGVITQASAALVKVSGYSREEMIGQRHSIITHQDTPKTVHKDIWQTITQGNTWYGEILDKNKQGKSFWLEHVITPDFDNQGEITGYTSISQDITLRKQVEALSLIDSLTQIANRRRLDNRINDELARFARYHKSFSLIVLDLDNFKRINDNYGHDIGDTVLVEFATLLTKHSRKTDLVGRWGGEEFLIICPETQLGGAKSLAETIREATAQYPFTQINSATISLGVAECMKGDDLASLFSRADRALYQAKSDGRNRVITQEDIE